MNRDELVEAIVNEVKRVLALRGVTVGAAQTQTSAAGSATPAPKPAQQPAGSTDLTGKQVITQKDFEAYKGQTVNVSKKVVITPLAYDYAKEKGITIIKVDLQAPQPVQPGFGKQVFTAVLAVAPNFPGDAGFVKKFLAAKGFQIKEAAGKTYESAVNELSGIVARGEAHFGVCIEKTGMEAPIYANRNSAIRAVHCRETFDARAARVDIGANVVVINASSNPEAVISGFIGL
jgi:hypothetical protein